MADGVAVARDQALFSGAFYAPNALAQASSTGMVDVRKAVFMSLTGCSSCCQSNSMLKTCHCTRAIRPKVGFCCRPQASLAHWSIAHRRYPNTAGAVGRLDVSALQSRSERALRVRQGASLSERAPVTSHHAIQRMSDLRPANDPVMSLSKCELTSTTAPARH